MTHALIKIIVFLSFLHPQSSSSSPHRPHPHNLVGKEGCKKGVCTLEINTDDMKMVFSNLGIQCVKRRDIEEALKTREEIRVDPYRSESSHDDN
jgi:c-Rel proto-oncogene protein